MATPRFIFSLGVLFVVGLVVSGTVRAQTTPASAAPNSAGSLLAESAQRLADGDYEGAISDASTALLLDPKNPAAYEARGAIYIQEKLWDRAERDYTAAFKLSPDPVYKFKLGEIKFLQKSYEDAQSRFASLKDDPNLGQLSAYKAFLCDLLGGHEPAAARDLAERDQAPEGPARYYCHAAWYLYHNQRAEAGNCFKVANDLYGNSVRELYLSSLMETRRFQLDTVTFTTRDGINYSGVSVFLESAGLRVSTSNGWVTVPIAQLPDDLSAFPENLREQIDRKRAVITASTPTNATTFVSFTTRSGQKYENVRWALTNAGLSVLTPDGWTRVPFKDLPSDLSAFPPDVQRAITEKINTSSAGPLEADVVSFVTRQGKSYTSVKAQPGPEGLRVLTPDGWVVVAYRDLPDDIASFPTEWQKSIDDQRRAPNANGTLETSVVTFTTRQGKTFTDAHAELGLEGLRVLTSNGWIVVTYADLPNDISSFPSDWQSEIKERRSEAEHDVSSMQVISFTTNRGVRYDQVRASMEKSGLILITPDGLVAVPYGQLPTDLSAFPASWRDAIAAKQSEKPAH